VLDQVSRGMSYSLSSLLKAWNAAGVRQIMVERVAENAVENYGVVDIGGHLAKPFSSIKINKLVEKPSYKDAPSDLAVLGRYILSPAVLDVLESTQVGVGGEIQLTDALGTLPKIDNLNAFFNRCINI
jgi:UTP--glucose-1-phosphate uridylyltransferase